jgi:hypothetical protein
LPCSFKIELDASTTYLLDLVGGYHIECMSTGLLDLCTGLTTFLMSNLTTDIGLEKTAAEDTEELNEKVAGTCELGGVNSGTVLGSGGLMFVTGKTLQFS